MKEFSTEHISLRSIDELSLWDQNYRSGDIPAIVASFQRFGFNGALRVWKKGVVAAGNQSLSALRAMREAGSPPPKHIIESGWEWYVPCLDVSDLPKAEAMAFAIADNRTHDLGEDDDERLASLLKEISLETGDLTGTGYSQTDLDELLNKIAIQDAEALQDPGPKDVDAKDFGEVRPQLGDIWRLGRHRLMCADGTNHVNVEKLMEGATADLVFTDPPYGVDYVGKTKEALKIQNDNLGDEGTRKLVADLLRASPIKPGGSFYICSPAGVTETAFRLAIADAGLDLKQTIVWAKHHFVMGRQDYHWRHESVLYGWRKGAAHYFVDDRTKDTVWEFDRPTASEDHPTTKPLELVEEAINNSSVPGDAVYDCCVGSGTTIIACERLSRTAYALELDPRYCEASLRRWEEMTGREAGLLSRLAA